jgi:hypothetical protein
MKTPKKGNGNIKRIPKMLCKNINDRKNNGTSFYFCIKSHISKKKIKLYPLHAMEAPGGRGGIAPTHT